MRERNQAILAGRRVVITLERRRRTSQDNDAFLDLRPYDGNVPRVISWSLFLFIGCLVLFIDDDEPHVFQRRKDSAARADNNPRAARMNLVPFVVALALG